MCFKFKRIRLHVLVLNDNNELEIINLSNQDTPLYFGYIPLFNINLWEHAYYLNYENDRSKYIDNFEKYPIFLMQIEFIIT